MTATATTKQPKRFSAAWITSLLRVPDPERSARTRRDRKSPRYPYLGSQALLEIRHNGEAPQRYPVVTRDLSREAASFIVVKFLYPGSTVRLNLRALEGGWKPLLGRVVRCRYLPGTPMLHEVAILFGEPIEVELFHSGARPKEILTLDEEGLTTQLARNYLKHSNAQIENVDDVDTLLAAHAEHHFDVILLDAETHATADRIELIKRMTGGATPLLVMTANQSPTAHQALLEAGATAVLPKPFNGDSLCSLIDQHMRRVLVSDLAGDLELCDLICDFVAGLRERLHEVRYLRDNNDLEGFRREVLQLAADGEMYGYQPVAAAARHCADQLDMGADEDAVRAGIAELVAWVHAVRAPFQRKG